MTVSLDPGRLDRFLRGLASLSRKRIPHETLWRLFASAFPERPAGSDERRWMLRALEHAREEGVITFPSPNGHRWDRSREPHVPASVDRVAGEDDEAPDRAWQDFAWHPSLSWVLDLDGLSQEQFRLLEAVHRQLTNGGFDESVPVAQRSLQLLGDEKRLGQLRRTRLFGEGRLSLEMLGCEPDPTPLAWERVGESSRALVFENAAGFAVARRVLEDADGPAYGMLVYGAGTSFPDSLSYLTTLDVPLTSISYVGDLDAFGLKIALQAQKRAQELSLPAVEPAVRLHRTMLAAARTLGQPEGWAYDKSPPSEPVEELVGFLSDDLRDQVADMIAEGRRVPEEVLTPSILAELWSAD